MLRSFFFLARHFAARFFEAAGPPINPEPVAREILNAPATPRILDGPHHDRILTG